jgi:TM2 domain-containing membrane protein YozV
MTQYNVVRKDPAGSTGNVIAALASFFIAGLGQLLQGRVLWGLFWFMAAAAAWVLSVLSLGLLTFLGGLVHILSCIHAALYRPR